MSLSKRALLVFVAAGLLASPLTAADSKKAKLELKVLPFMGSPTTEFLFVADLKGGAETEGLYCPTLEWEWGRSEDTSAQEPECPPFQAGVTRIERRFSISRRFAEGQRTATLFLRKDGKVIARASVSFRVTWEKKPPTGTFAGPPR